MRSLWVSPRRLKNHELHSTLRYIKIAGATWHDILIRLGELQQAATTRFVKLLSTVVVICLVLRSFGDSQSVSLSLGGITISAPAAFVSFSASLTTLVMMQSLQAVLMIMSFRSREAVIRKFGNFSGNAYGFYHGQDESALVVPAIVNSFIKEKFPISSWLSAVMMLCYGTFLIPLAAIWVYLWNYQGSIIQSSSLLNVAGIIALAGELVLLSTIVLLLLFNTPMPFRKNAFSIRWGFLSPLYPVGLHPRSECWLAEENTNKK